MHRRQAGRRRRNQLVHRVPAHVHPILRAGWLGDRKQPPLKLLKVGLLDCESHHQPLGWVRPARLHPATAATAAAVSA